ncbi:glutaminase [Maribellus sp. YY47]|uniref:glutaminase n=1 Tax=Maribellus sp. YY47 TaxID=2929486 RepID=UPI0020010AEE|nr:glutaminase [Maribellus sp. YY47]MCK3686068.1 glutaminase [Maribellus sp. YY47]
MTIKMDYGDIISEIFEAVKNGENTGEVAQYIPELSGVDPEKFGVYLTTLYGKGFGTGDCETRFSIQSISKVLSLSLAYGILGDKIWERVGVEPSGTPFNSLIQLETDNGIPRNPLINGGALVICDMLISELKDAPVDFLAFVRKLSKNSGLEYSAGIARSEKSVGYRNIALCNFIKSYGNIRNEPDEVLDFYFNMCSLEMNCRELTQTFMYLVDTHHVISNSATLLNMSQTKRLNALMQTCGFYDESGEFSFKVGLPGKSGVGGGIVAIHPEKYCIAVWSPKLNLKGNSYRGMKFLELFTTRTELSIF